MTSVESVISAAIAVLVMAFIGVAMWFAFSNTFNHAATHVDNQVNCIGQSLQQLLNAVRRTPRQMTRSDES